MKTNGLMALLRRIAHRCWCGAKPWQQGLCRQHWDDEQFNRQLESIGEHADA